MAKSRSQRAEFDHATKDQSPAVQITEFIGKYTPEIGVLAQLEQPMAKPDFTGTWQFNPNKSSLQIPAPESSTFVIEHNEPRFHLERTHVFGGKGDTFSIDLLTDGQAVVLHHGDFEIRASLAWEGETLVFDSTLARAGEQATNLVRYTLVDEGRLFIAEEQLRSAGYSHDNTWVFDRQ
jgi:hypothetical protein